jgi:hypothetical protein
MSKQIDDLEIDEWGSATAPSLEALLRRASRFAEMIFNKTGSLRMTWLIESPKGQAMIFTPIHEGMDKDALSDFMRMLFAKHDVTRYAVAMESWMVLSSAYIEGLRISEHEQRQEVVLLEASDGREHLHTKRDIVRPENGKPYLAKLGEIDRKWKVAGRFTNMLPDRPQPVPTTLQ